MQDRIEITFLGHATTLIDTPQGVVLTDPHLGRRMFWWRRHKALGPLPGSLPGLAAVLVSHGHLDHLDIESFKYIPSNVPVIVPPKLGALLHRFINNPVVECAHWTPHPLREGLQILPVPVRHPGGRLLPGWRYPNVSAYLITAGDRRIYFAGDTAYGTHFREVGHLHAIDVALLPLTTILPARLHLGRSLTPLELLQAFLDLKAGHAIPIHWGSFGWASAWERKLARLRRFAEERQCVDRLHMIEPGAAWGIS
ncbi:MAG: MBL fold metallo-hydrolase [Deltaproteobacteria bacterium]|nr:MBL fold metallo-hydrolase [Deltaproteobacteria bacterium]